MPIKENKNRNKAMVCLKVGGFSNYEGANLLDVDRRNYSKLLRKYFPQYKEEVIQGLRRGIKKYKKSNLYVGKATGEK